MGDKKQARYRAVKETRSLDPDFGTQGLHLLLKLQWQNQKSHPLFDISITHSFQYHFLMDNLLILIMKPKEPIILINIVKMVDSCGPVGTEICEG